MEGCIFGEDEDGESLLLECYGEKRPKPPLSSVVMASEKPYVTVHDYLSVVHPWLLGLRGEIFTAMNVGDEPLPENTKLMVNHDAAYSLSIMEEEMWFGYKRSGRFLHISGRRRGILRSGTLRVTSVKNELCGDDEGQGGLGHRQGEFIAVVLFSPFCYVSSRSFPVKYIQVKPFIPSHKPVIQYSARHSITPYPSAAPPTSNVPSYSSPVSSWQ